MAYSVLTFLAGVALSGIGVVVFNPEPPFFLRWIYTEDENPIIIDSFRIYNAALGFEKEGDQCYFPYGDTIKIRNISTKKISINEINITLILKKNKFNIEFLTGNLENPVMFESVEEVSAFLEKPISENNSGWRLSEFPIQIPASSEIVIRSEVYLNAAKLSSTGKDMITVIDSCFISESYPSFFKEVFSDATIFRGQSYVRRIGVDKKFIVLSENDGGVIYHGQEINF